jgi:hypothetical protein
LAGAKTPTGLTVSLKKVFLHKLDFFIFVSRSLPGWPYAGVVCRPPSSFPLVVRCLTLHAVIIRRLRCPPLSLSAIAIITHHRHCHLPPPCSVAAMFCRRSHHPLFAVSAFSRRPLFSFPILVRRPILHAVVFRSYCCLPSPSSSTAAVFHRHSHHHHSGVSAISHCPLLSFSIAVCCPFLHFVAIPHRRHLLPPSSAIAVPPLLVLPPTLRC